MSWLGRLFHKSRAEDELDKELRFHLEQKVAVSPSSPFSPWLSASAPPQSSSASSTTCSSTRFLIKPSTGRSCLNFAIQRTPAHRKAALTSHPRNSAPSANRIMSLKT